MAQGKVYLSGGTLDGFIRSLEAADRSANTVAKYRRDLGGFMAWLDGREVTVESMTGYRRKLLADGMAAGSVNSVLAAMNGFCSYMGRPDLKAGFLRVQRRVFRDESRDLTRDDYDRLVSAAYGAGRTRLGLLLETVGSTGIRVSELGYVTVESLSAGRFDVDLKGKIRTVMLPARLREKLGAYAAEHGIESGSVFVTRNGRPISRQQVWREMKSLCGPAGIPASKVYPHNFRHMFATVFYGACGDIVKLADVLGHSSIETTRIYLVSSGEEHARQLEKLGLVR